ncbi:MAG: tyrosine-type recombinase/integrase [candidate division Zixibacteria bacterium]|nr:tyrosine-type recombinase/integrase [candidate division Zixibacteria bacterium]
MGIYRRKDKDGKPFGPYIVQYPYAVGPVTGKVKYTAIAAGLSKRLAKQIFAQKMLEWEKKKHLGLETKKDYTFRELVDWYLNLSGTLKLKSSKKILQHCRTLKAHFGNMLARDIKPHMIEEYQQQRLSHNTYRATPYKPSSVNREFEVIKRIFNLALREELVDKNPCFKVSKLSENNARERVLSYEEFVKLTEALPHHAAEIVRMGYYTGMRFGEVVGLTWARVNLEKGYICLTPEETKTEKPRRVYFVPQVFEVLERAKKIRGISHNHVFIYQGKPLKSIKTTLRRALKKTGIEDFTLHDLRHTYNTNMRKAGVQRSVIMKLTGHATLSMYNRYNTVDEEDAKDAVAKFKDFLARESEITANSTAEKKERVGDKA